MAPVAGVETLAGGDAVSAERARILSTLLARIDMVTDAGDSREGREAALTLAAPLIRFIHVASTLAGQAYVEFRQLAVAEADRNRRDLLEVLLAGELPARGPLNAAAKAHGI